MHKDQLDTSVKTSFEINFRLVLSKDLFDGKLIYFR